MRGPWALFLVSSVHVFGQQGLRPPTPRIESVEGAMRLSVEDGRPLAKAAEALEARFGWRINYEDPARFCSQEVTEFTPRDRFPSVRQKPILIPRPVRVEISFAPPRDETMAADRKRILTMLVEAHRAATGKRYEVLEQAEGCDLVPTGFMDAQCRFVERAPLLNTRITVPLGYRNLNGSIREILQALRAASGQYIGFAGPINFMLQTPTKFSATNEPARSVLHRVLQSTRPKLAWQVFTDAETGESALNLHFVEHHE